MVAGKAAGRWQLKVMEQRELDRSQLRAFLWDLAKALAHNLQCRKTPKRWCVYFAVVGLCPLFIR
jgi:hypothetical protein